MSRQIEALLGAVSYTAFFPIGSENPRCGVLFRSTVAKSEWHLFAPYRFMSAVESSEKALGVSQARGQSLVTRQYNSEFDHLLLWMARQFKPDLEKVMAINVVLSVGLDAWQLTAQSLALKSAGFVFIAAMSIREAIEQFHAGDFDLVLLGHSIPKEQRERLTSLIRSSGSRTPVVCIPKSPGDGYSISDATLNGDPSALIKGMKAVLAKTVKARTVLPGVRGFAP